MRIDTQELLEQSKFRPGRGFDDWRELQTALGRLKITTEDRDRARDWVVTLETELERAEATIARVEATAANALLREADGYRNAASDALVAIHEALATP